MPDSEILSGVTLDCGEDVLRRSLPGGRILARYQWSSQSIEQAFAQGDPMLSEWNRHSRPWRSTGVAA